MVQPTYQGQELGQMDHIFWACILDLQLALSMKVKRLQIYGDSMLIILQTIGE